MLCLLHRPSPLDIILGLKRHKTSDGHSIIELKYHQEGWIRNRVTPSQVQERRATYYLQHKKATGRGGSALKSQVILQSENKQVIWALARGCSSTAVTAVVT
jgi:hypothetical protein